MRAEVIPEGHRYSRWPAARATSSLLLFDTDLMGTIGTVEINPGVEQTAYGVFSDLVDITQAHGSPNLSP